MKHRIKQPISESTKLWQTFSLLDVKEILDLLEKASTEVPFHRDLETTDINLQIHYIRASINKFYQIHKN